MLGTYRISDRFKLNLEIIMSISIYQDLIEKLSIWKKPVVRFFLGGGGGE